MISFSLLFIFFSPQFIYPNISDSNFVAGTPEIEIAQIRGWSYFLSAWRFFFCAQQFLAEN